MRTIIGIVLILAGLFTYLTAVVGIFRFHYVINRMHVAALGDTVGIAGVLAGCILLRGFDAASAKFLLLLFFFWLTAPVSSHLIAKMEVLTLEEKHRRWEEETR